MATSKLSERRRKVLDALQEQIKSQDVVLVEDLEALNKRFGEAKEDCDEMALPFASKAITKSAFVWSFKLSVLNDLIQLSHHKHIGFRLVDPDIWYKRHPGQQPCFPFVYGKPDSKVPRHQILLQVVLGSPSDGGHFLFVKVHKKQRSLTFRWN